MIGTGTISSLLYRLYNHNQEFAASCLLGTSLAFVLRFTVADSGE